MTPSKPSPSGLKSGTLEPAISLVVCTRNRAQYLPPALQSFSRLVCRQPWELILVDSASTDQTPALLADFSHASPVPVRVLQSARPGLSIARNLGWRAARGKVVAFTDDDCYPREDFLEATVRLFNDIAELGFVGGRVLLHDPADLPITIQTLDEVLVLPARTHLAAGLIHGANFAIRRSLLEALQGFDNRLGAGAKLIAGEDTDILVRALGSGAAGRYDPAVVVEHHHRRQNSEDADKLDKGYAIGRGAYHAKLLVDTRSMGLALKLKYLRHWYWSIRQKLRKGNKAAARQELSGAAHYLWLAVSQGRHVSD